MKLFHDHILAESDPKIPLVKRSMGNHPTPRKEKLAWLVEEIEKEEQIWEKA